MRLCNLRSNLYLKIIFISLRFRDIAITSLQKGIRSFVRLRARRNDDITREQREGYFCERARTLAEEESLRIGRRSSLAVYRRKQQIFYYFYVQMAALMAMRISVVV